MKPENEEPDFESIYPGTATNGAEFRSAEQDIERGKTDKETIATLSVRIYFTTEFEAVTSDIGSFMADVVAEANQGYVNSEVKVRMELECVERFTLPEVESAKAMLERFANYKASYKALLGSADVAILIGEDNSEREKEQNRKSIDRQIPGRLLCCPCSTINTICSCRPRNLR